MSNGAPEIPAASTDDDDATSQRRSSTSSLGSQGRRSSIVTDLQESRNSRKSLTCTEPIAETHASRDIDLLRRTYSKARKTLTHYDSVNSQVVDSNMWDMPQLEVENLDVDVLATSEDTKGVDTAPQGQLALDAQGGDVATSTTPQDAKRESSKNRSNRRRTTVSAQGASNSSPMNRRGTKQKSRVASKVVASAPPEEMAPARTKAMLGRVQCAARSIMHGAGETMRERREAADNMARNFIAAFRNEQLQSKLKDLGEDVDDVAMEKLSEAFTLVSALKIKRVESLQNDLIKVLDTTADGKQSAAAWLKLRNNLKLQLDELNNSSSAMMRTMEEASQQASDVKQFFSMVSGVREELVYNRRMSAATRPKPMEVAEPIAEPIADVPTQFRRQSSEKSDPGLELHTNRRPARQRSTKYLLDTAVKRIVCVNQVKKLTAAAQPLSGTKEAVTASQEETDDVQSSLEPIAALTKHVTKHNTRQSTRNPSESDVESDRSFGPEAESSEAEDEHFGESKAEERKEDQVTDFKHDRGLDNKTKSMERLVVVKEGMKEQEEGAERDGEEVEDDELVDSAKEEETTQEMQAEVEEDEKAEEVVVSVAQFLDDPRPMQASEPAMPKTCDEEPERLLPEAGTKKKRNRNRSPRRQQLRKKGIDWNVDRQHAEEDVDEERPSSHNLRISKRHIRNMLSGGGVKPFGSPLWASKFLQVEEGSGSDAEDYDVAAEIRPQSKSHLRPSAPSSAAGGTRPRQRNRQQNLVLEPKPESTGMLRQRGTKAFACHPRLEAITTDRMEQADPKRCLAAAREQEKKLWVPRLELKPLLGSWDDLDEDRPASKTVRSSLLRDCPGLEESAPPTLSQTLAPLSARPGTGTFRRFRERFVEVLDDSHQSRASSFVGFHCKLSRHLMSR